MLVVSYDAIFVTIVQLIITLYFQFCTVSVQLSVFSVLAYFCRKLTFCALKMLAVLANETSAIIQFRFPQLLSGISPKEREAVEVKI